MRKIAVLFAALALMTGFSACGNSRAGETKLRDLTVQTQELQTENRTENPKPEPEPTVLPTATSADAELYVLEENGTKSVVNRYGTDAAGYRVDEEGNILDAGGAVQVAAANAEPFIRITAFRFSRDDCLLTLDAREEPVDWDENVTRINQYPVNTVLSLNVSPDGATDRTVLLRSTDVNVAEIRANSNQGILAEGDFNLQNGQIAVCPADGGTALQITVTGKCPGQAKIMAETVSGSVCAECVINVQYGSVPSMPVPTETPTGFVNASGDATQHVHSYSKTVVEPTIRDTGYTLYTCTECGYSYQDCFTSKLPVPEQTEAPHVHHYAASVVSPTETETGYTLYVCEGCGDSYRDNFVKPSGGR